MSAMSQSPFLHLRAETSVLCPCLLKPLPKQTEPGMLSLFPLAQCSTPSAVSAHSCLRVIFSGRWLCVGMFLYTHMHRKMCSPKEETTLSANYLISAIIVLFKPQQSTHTCLIKSLLKRNIVLFLPTGPPTPWYHYNYCQILLLQEGTNCIDLSLIWQWPI